VTCGQLFMPLPPALEALSSWVVRAYVCASVYESIFAFVSPD